MLACPGPLFHVRGGGRDYSRAGMDECLGNALVVYTCFEKVEAKTMARWGDEGCMS